ncbi:hypothetical protein C0J52_08914 [Blattella germanica]|nr:hypothetical protein C0J52_08914 [Blattella germanica]
MNFNEPNPLALSQLGYAARMGDTFNVCKLLKQNRRIDIADNRGWNAIHEAAYGGHVDCLELLLEMGKEGQQYVNNKNMEGETPLSLACSNLNNPAILQLLLDNGANVNLGDNEQFTPLHKALMLASQDGSLKLVEELLKRGANPNLLATDNTMAIHLSVHNAHLSIVDLLLRKTNKDALLLSAGAHADGLVCLAIDCESIEVLKTLLSSDLGEEILQVPVYRNITIYCDVNFFYEEANPINFPVNATCGNSLSPLESLIFCNLPDDVKESCLDLLVSHNIDLDRSTRISEVPDALYLACIKNNIRLMWKLLRVGISGLTEDLLLPLHKIYFCSSSLECSLSPPRIETLAFLQRLGTSKGSSKRILNGPLPNTQLAAVGSTNNKNTP